VSAGRASPPVLALACAALAAPAPARAQTMLDQELRLVELHSLLVALPALAPPGAWRGGQGSAGLEVVTIPVIDGTTGGKVQITASDRTRAFPRLRLALGLPLGEPWRGFVGLAYIPPIQLNEVSSHLGGAEAGLAWTGGPLAVGLRGQLVYATSRSPVTEPGTRDTLRTVVAGADLSAGLDLALPFGALTPWIGGGLARVDGRFRVLSDGALLSSATTRGSLSAGVRLVTLRHLEASAEVVAYPGRLVHPNLRLAWTGDLLGGRSPPAAALPVQ
jgi:hypothetical protein